MQKYPENSEHRAQYLTYKAALEQKIPPCVSEVSDDEYEYSSKDNKWWSSDVIFVPGLGKQIAGEISSSLLSVNPSGSISMFSDL